MTVDPRLIAAVKEFAEGITATVQAVLGHAEVALVVTAADEVLTVSADRPGIVLSCSGRHVLTLVVKLRCGWDSTGSFIAVDRSEFHVFAEGDGEPLFRIEYDRDANKSLPVAHLHVHAHRDATAWAMSQVGVRSERARRRGRRQEVPSMKDLHLPLGGKRFRPCLEDVLQFLVEEFGVHAADGWKQGLETGRAQWRHNQVRSAARDAPEEAAAVLRRLGYTVVAPDVIPVESAEMRRY